MEEARELLGRFGFVLPRGGRAQDADEAAEIASRVGFPVVIKVASRDLLHKTDVGGVRLGLWTKREVRDAFRTMMGVVHRAAPGARVLGADVEEMVRDGAELFIGLQWNPQFGPVIAFGLGGIFTEILSDVTFRLLPIEAEEAEEMLTEIRARKVLEGFRGREAVSREALVDLLVRAGRMGMALAGRLGSIDLNPIVLLGKEHRVLDAKVLLEEAPRPLGRVAEPDTRYVARFFDATSVAVVGASATPGKIGYAILRSLLSGKYTGTVYPVNPGRDEILGAKAYPSLSAIPGPVDLAVAAIPLTTLPALVKECAAKGTHNLVIVSGGGKELGEEGVRLEQEIARLAKGGDVRIVGPNCIGVLSAANHLDTFFQEPERMVRPKAGALALLTQSGTVGVAVLEKVADLGVSRFVSYGNRLDVDEADLIAYLGEDPQTRVIACYVEGVADGRKFIASAQKVAVRKPVVVFKSARTPAGAKGAVSHTGFFGGTYDAWRGAFAQGGLIAVDSAEGLVAASRALVLQPRAAGPRVALISNGAGPMIQALDLLGDHGLEVARLGERTLAQMKATFPPYFVVGNPLDVTGSATSKDYDAGLSFLLGDANVDLVMAWFVFQDAPLDEGIVDVLASLPARFPGKPILCGASGGEYTERISRAIESRGVPVFPAVAEWLVAASALARVRPLRTT